MNWDKIRNHFKALENQTFLMTAATGPTSEAVYKAQKKHIDMLHTTGDIHWLESVELLEQTREAFTAFLNAPSPKNIGFGPNTSHNMNIIAFMLQSDKVQKVLLAEEEFPSSSIPWAHWGYDLEFLPIATISQMDDFSKYDIVCISHIQYGTGFRAPINTIGPKVKAHNKKFIVNATQSIGAFPIDISACQADALTSSLHKWFCAGYGCSLLYISSPLLAQKPLPFAGWLSVENPELMDNKNKVIRKEASAIETGVPSFTTMIAVNAALKWIESIGIDKVSDRILELSHYAYENAKKRNFNVISVRDENPLVSESINSGTLLVHCKNSEEVVEQMMKKNIFITSRSGALRISIHYYNNKKDIDHLFSEIDQLDASQFQ